MEKYFENYPQNEKIVLYYMKKTRKVSYMIIKRDFVYTPTGKNRTLHIYLPDNYEKTDEHYPVMYFFDGQGFFEEYTAVNTVSV